MIKQLIAASGAALMAVLPAQARVEKNTGELMRLLDSYGVNVQTFTDRAGCEGSMGMFTLRPSLTLKVCYTGSKPTAEDHDTVRHETWHYLQWCKNPKATPLLPLHKDRDQYIRFVQNALSESAIERINLSYPEYIRAVEYEAFAAARSLTATQLMGMVRKYCTPV